MVCVVEEASHCDKNEDLNNDRARIRWHSFKEANLLPDFINACSVSHSIIRRECDRNRAETRNDYEGGVIGVIK